MIHAATPMSLERIQLIRATIARETRHVAGEIAGAEDQAQAEAQEARHQQNVIKIHKELVAQRIERTSLLGGLIHGGIMGLVTGLSQAMLFPVAVANPLLGSALNTLLALPSAVLGAAAVGVSEAGIGRAAASPAVAIVRSESRDAGMLAEQAELAEATHEAAAKSARLEEGVDAKALQRTRKAIAAMRDERRQEAQLKAAHLGGSTTEVDHLLGGASAAMAAQAHAVELLGAEAVAAAAEARGEISDSLALRRESIADRREAAKRRNHNDLIRAVLGIVDEAVKIAGMIFSGGAVGAASQLAGAAGGLVSALITDERARQLERHADALERAAARLREQAEDAGTEREGAERLRDRVQDGVRQLRAVLKAGSGRRSAGGQLSYAAIQKLRAQISLEEQKDARDDVRIARADRFAEEEQAYQAHLEGDAEESKKEAQGLVFAAIGLAISVVGSGAPLAPGLAANGLDLAEVERGLKVAGALKSATDGLNQLLMLTEGYADKKREAERRAERIELQAKRAQDRAADAKDDLDEARESQRRSLEAALEIARNLNPQLA